MFHAPSAIGELDSFSLEFDPSNNETLVNASNNPIGIGNEWSISQWIKRGTSVLNKWHIEIIRSSDNNNKIRILHADIAARIHVDIRNSTGTVFKSYRWLDSLLVPNEWTHLVLTWNGTDLLLYVNGVNEVPASKTTDDSGAQTSTDRRVLIGTSDINGADLFEGRMYSTSIHSVALDQANITEIYQGRGSFDLRVDQGNYNQSANMPHYWRHGFNAGDIGEDLGNGTPININNAGGLLDGEYPERVPDAP